MDNRLSGSEPIRCVADAGLPGARVAAAFGWAELFILVGFQYFWVLHKSHPLSTEDLGSLIPALVPFAVMLATGFLTRMRGFRAALLGVEWGLHLLAAGSQWVLVLLVVTHDPFDMLVPYTWPFYAWTVAMGLVMLANLAQHERHNAVMSGAGWHAAGPVVLVWGVALATAAAMRSPAWCWAVSALAHAWMAPQARAARGTTVPGQAPVLTCFGATFESVALLMAALRISLLLASQTPVVGAIEVKYQMVFAPFLSPWFAGGVGLFLVARRLRVAWAVHGALVGLAAWGGPYAIAAAPLLYGYVAVALFDAARRQAGPGYAFSAIVAGFVCFLIPTGHMFSALLDNPMAAGALGPLLAGSRWIAVAAFALAAALAVLLRVRPMAEPANLAQTASNPRQFALLALLILAVGLPALAFATLFSFPNVRVQRPDRIHVGRPAGVCHAGYSKSDEEYAVLEQLGVSLMRIDFHWAKIQPAPDTWDFSRFDEYVDTARRHGQEVLAIFSFDNDAVEQAPDGQRKGRYIAPADVPLFLEYVRRATAHFKGRVYAWEIWNEPSLPLFWNGSADEFYDLARRTAEAAREADPDIRLIGTAMHSPMGVWMPYQMEGLYVRGALAQVDHPSFHLYIADPRAYTHEFARVLACKRQYGHPGSPWITELGDPDGGGYPWRASPQLLADHVIKAHVAATSTGMGKLIWYCFEDGGRDGQRRKPMDSEGYFGLLGPGRQWKPAAHAYRLFNAYCTESELRSDVLHRTGGVTARQVRATLYRRDNGDSALILWYEPTLAVQDTARITLDLGPLDEPALVHDIDSGYTKELLDNAVDVSERPLFITYRARTAEQPATAAVAGAVYDTLIPLLLAAALLASGVACARHRTVD